jgi:cytidine deaminase
VAGYRPGEIEAVAITASPCGGCRQWLYEFKVDRVVFPTGGDLVKRTTAELLPDAWDDL